MERNSVIKITDDHTDPYTFLQRSFTKFLLKRIHHSLTVIWSIFLFCVSGYIFSKVWTVGTLQKQVQHWIVSLSSISSSICQCGSFLFKSVKNFKVVTMREVLIYIALNMSINYFSCVSEDLNSTDRGLESHSRLNVPHTFLLMKNLHFGEFCI